MVWLLQKSSFKKGDFTMKRRFLGILVVIITNIIIVYFYGCDSSIVQPMNNQPIIENPDTVVSEYNHGEAFMLSYQPNVYPGLRIDSVEKSDTTPPYILRQGFLIIYLNNQFVDSIPYGPNYNWPGARRPSISGGYISRASHQYLLKIKNDRDQMYSQAKSYWYLINYQTIKQLPKVPNKDGNGMYENHSANIDIAYKGGNRLIFFGAYYCLRETYCVFDANNMMFKNYSRIKDDCYFPWHWE
jgi:hypothetical protein